MDLLSAEPLGRGFHDVAAPFAGLCFAGSPKEKLAMANVQEISENNFEAEVLKSDVPVLVDFWAPWCGPCRMVGPVLEELSDENAGSVRVTKVNIDDNQTLATNYQVSSIPTIMLFKGGEVMDRFVGVQPKNRLQQALDQAIS